MALAKRVIFATARTKAHSALADYSRSAKWRRASCRLACAISAKKLPLPRGWPAGDAPAMLKLIVAVLRSVELEYGVKQCVRLMVV
mgnify:CR=1 FL=1